jgi:hypothetical protein
MLAYDSNAVNPHACRSSLARAAQRYAFITDGPHRHLAQARTARLVNGSSRPSNPRHLSFIRWEPTL